MPQPMESENFIPMPRIDFSHQEEKDVAWQVEDEDPESQVGEYVDYNLEDE